MAYTMSPFPLRFGARQGGGAWSVAADGACIVISNLPPVSAPVATPDASCIVVSG